MTVWDALWFDDDASTAYRLTAKRMTVGDAVAKGALEDEIAMREDLKGRLLLRLVNEYPLLKFGTRACECVVLDAAPEHDDNGGLVIPDDAGWQSFTLTEQAFLDMPDVLLWLWLSEVVAKNPQYDRTWEMLKKNLARVLQQNPSSESTTDESDTANASETTSSDG